MNVTCNIVLVMSFIISQLCPTRIRSICQIPGPGKQNGKQRLPRKAYRECSGRVLDSRPSGPRVRTSSASLRCVLEQESLLKILVQSRKARPDKTEYLLTGTSNKQTKTYAVGTQKNRLIYRYGPSSILQLYRASGSYLNKTIS